MFNIKISREDLISVKNLVVFGENDKIVIRKNLQWKIRM